MLRLANGNSQFPLKMEAARSSETSEKKTYRGADTSLARPGRKHIRKLARDACDFNNIDTQTIIKFFFYKAKCRRKLTPF